MSINQVNKIGFSEEKLSILTFYYRKVSPIGDNSDTISGVSVVPDITGVDKEEN